MVKVKKVTSQVAKKSVVAVKNEINKVKKTAKLGKVKKTAKETTRKVKQQLVTLQGKKEKRETKLKKMCEDRGVVYLKHIPHGFYEKEMYEYFRQFGKVTAIKLPRSKNGKSKGFAFIEFEYKEIAKVVADTMNNYLMFDQLLVTEYIPPEKQKPHFFHRASMPWDDTSNKEAVDQRRRMDRISKNKPVADPVKFVTKSRKVVRKLHSNLLKKTGIDYEFQVNEPPENEKVQLVSMKRKSQDATTPLNNVTVTKTKATPKRRKLKTNSLNETDVNLRIKPPPNKVAKFLKSSKSKLKTVKNKADAVKIKLKTEAKANKKVKELKSRVKDVKNKAKNVIKNSTSNVGKNKTNKKVNNKTKTSVKNGKFTKKVANKSTKKIK